MNTFKIRAWNSDDDSFIRTDFVSHPQPQGGRRVEQMQASHLSDQIFLFHLKFCFVVNDVDNNFTQRLMSLMNEHLTNADEQMLISPFDQNVF